MPVAKMVLAELIVESGRKRAAARGGRSQQSIKRRMGEKNGWSFCTNCPRMKYQRQRLLPVSSWSRLSREVAIRAAGCVCSSFGGRWGVVRPGMSSRVASSSGLPSHVRMILALLPRLQFFRRSRSRQIVAAWRYAPLCTHPCHCSVSPAQGEGDPDSVDKEGALMEMKDDPDLDDEGNLVLHTVWVSCRGVVGSVAQRGAARLESRRKLNKNARRRL